MLRFAVTRDGAAAPLTDYLGAKGHLVLLRVGDLGYLHTHPDDDALDFENDVPEPGRYRPLPPVPARRQGAHVPFTFGRDVSALPSAAELPIEGMTCASCATRIEKRLNKLDGVEATVNYATENAAVDFDPLRVSPDRSDRRDRGGRATTRRSRAGRARGGDEAPAAPRGPRLIVSALLSLPVLLLAMIPSAAVRQLAVALAPARDARRALGRLAVPQGGLRNLRHATATMDTLISLGTLAAWGWSIVALFFPCGDPSMRMPSSSLGPVGASQIYLEVAAGRDRRSSSRAAISRPAPSAGRRRAARAAGAGREGGERPRRDGASGASRSTSSGSATLRRAPRREDRHRRRRRRGHSAVDGRC